MSNTPLAASSRLFSGIMALGLLFQACASEKKCPYKPEAIFSSDLPRVRQYNFERKGQQSLESLLLDSGVLVEIGQDICESSRQEYRFIVRGDYAAYADSLWMKEASRQLLYLSALSENQSALKNWADALEMLRPQMKIGEALTVQPGIQIKVDKVVSPGQSTLIVLFSQD
jgi:hypothetical protein